MDKRNPLPIGTQIELERGGVFQITGEPIGCGGSGILYPAIRLLEDNGKATSDGIMYVLKECFPATQLYSFTRTDTGAVTAADGSAEANAFLARVQELQTKEGIISREIYKTASRVLVNRETITQAYLTLPDKERTYVNNTITVMDSLSEKGRCLTDWLKERGRFTTVETFRMIQQLLFALREVHEAGYLHLDIQDGNVFLRGTLQDKSSLVTLIDFGCARAMVHGKTTPIEDRVIFTTRHFTPPECLLQNDGTLCLGVEADIYSVGCLALYLLKGQKTDIEDLIYNSGKPFLKSNHLRRIKCPKHLVGKLQYILTKALEKDPANRYHSADEMLTDVTELVDALQPYRTDLYGVQYDAFVCYKHGEIDSAAAVTLQRALESYRAPKGVASKRRPFQRVFVDEGELASCADFGQMIEDALKNSGWLIVICSPDTPNSPWVQSEIETFLKYHDRSRILAVITDGDAAEALPPLLIGDANGYGEVYAPHAHGSSVREVVKNIKGDTLLKIAAPMLGTTYDSLKQRQKIHKLQRVAVAAAGVLALTASFATYAYNRAQVIEKQYHQALVNESLFLTEQAEKKIENNDPLGAIELLLQALPSEHQERPVLTQTEYDLSTVLGVYVTPASARNTITAVGRIEPEQSSYFLSKDGKYLFLWEPGTYGIQVLDADSLTLINALETEYIIYHISPDHIMSSKGLMFVQTYSSIVCVDFLTGEEMWSYELDGNKVVFSTLNFLDNELLVLWKGSDTTVLSVPDGGIAPQYSKIASTEYTVSAYSIETGDLKKESSFEFDEQINADFCFAVSPDFNHFAISSADQSIFVVNIDSGEIIKQYTSNHTVVGLMFLHERLAVIRTDGYYLSTTEGQIISEYVLPRTIWLEMYNYTTKGRTQEDLWTYLDRFYPKNRDTYSAYAVVYETTDTKGNGVLFAYGNKCLLIDVASSKVIRDYQMPDSIIDILLVDNGFETVNYDGSISKVDYLSDMVLTKTVLLNQVTYVCRSDDLFFVQSSPYFEKNYTIIKYQSEIYDEAYREVAKLNGGGWQLYGRYPVDHGINFVFTKDNQIALLTANGTIYTHNLPGQYVFFDRVEDNGTKVYWQRTDFGSSQPDFSHNVIYMISGEILETSPILQQSLVPSGVSGSEKMLYVLDKQQVNVFSQKNGELLCSINCEDDIAGVCFSPDEKMILICTREYIILKYRISDGMCVGQLNLSEYSQFYISSTYYKDFYWEYTNDDTLIVYSDYEAFLLDVSNDTLEIKAQVDYCFGYDRVSNCFYVACFELSDGEIGNLPYYSLDQLIQKGRAVLGKAE